MSAPRTLAQLQQAITIGTPFRSPSSGFRIQATGMYVLSSASEFYGGDDLGFRVKHGQAERTARYTDLVNTSPAAWMPAAGEPVYVVADLAGRILGACFVGDEPRTIVAETSQRAELWQQYTPRQQEAIAAGIHAAAEHRTRAGWDFER